MRPPLFLIPEDLNSEIQPLDYGLQVWGTLTTLQNKGQIQKPTFSFFQHSNKTFIHVIECFIEKLYLKVFIAPKNNERVFDE